jgi:hypothetical protein
MVVTDLQAAKAYKVFKASREPEVHQDLQDLQAQMEQQAQLDLQVKTEEMDEMQLMA